MNERKWTDRSLLIFIFMVIVISLSVEYLIASGGNGKLYLLLMWIPGLMAVAANIISLLGKKEKLSLRQFINRLGFRGCSIIYILLAILIPLIYLLIPYMIYWKIYPDNFAYNGVSIVLILQDILAPMILGILFNIISAAGEEIGWRGFMLPALSERYGTRKSILITSVFWVLWHLPLLMSGDYLFQGASPWYTVPAFILCIIPVGIIIGILTVKSGSVWPAILLHAAHNNFDQGIFSLITRGENMVYYVSESGILTIICAWIIAGVMIVRQMKHK